MRKEKLSYKILSSFLAMLMVFTSLPIVNTYAAVNEESKNLGTVSAITDKKAKIETNGSKTTVLFDNEIELDWVPADEGIQRGKDGWWVGVKLTAPEFADDEFYNVLKNSKYQSKAYGSDEWKTVNGKSFWESQDSDKTNTEENIERYITLWAFVNEANLTKAKKANENIKAEWRFDWICENTDANAEFSDAQTEQTVAVEVDPSKVTLNKNGKQVYPIVLKDASAITDKTVEPTTTDVNGVSTTTFLFDNDMTLNWVAADEEIQRGKDGWWVGVKLNAPDLGEEILSKSTYQSQAYGGKLVEGKSFWDARDSKNDSANGEYITLWAFVNEENLNNAKAANEAIEALWNFDWDNDGNIDQTVISQIKTDTVTLNRNGDIVYPATKLGLVTGITGSVDVADNATNSVTASYSDKVTLQWSKADPSIGRNVDGWWAGIKMTAPEGVDTTKVKYKSKAYGANNWITDKSFERNKDGKEFITLWACVRDQEMLDTAKNDNREIITQWGFDWNGDGVYEQYVNFELDPNNIVLDWAERYKLDTKAPVITVNDLADSKEEVKWSADSAIISGTVTDTQDDDYASKIKEVYCLNSKSDKVDNFEYKNENGEFSLTVTEEGEQEYTIVATDNSGKETTQKVYAKVDKTDPVINSVKIESESAELKAVNSAEPQIVKIDANDEQSGIASIVADGKDVTEKSEFEVTANGTYTVIVTDKVGKTTTKEILVDNFDNSAPSASLNLPDAGEATWIKDIKDFFRKLFKLEENETSIKSTVTLAVTDEKSDGENEKYSKITEAYYYIVNVNAEESNLETEVSKVTPDMVKTNGTSMITDGVLKPQEIELNVGESVVFVYAVDEANNELFDYSNGFVFEETKPQITVENGETEVANNADLKMNTAPNFVISVQDAAATDGGFVSGIQEVTMSVNNGDAGTLTKVQDVDNAANGQKGLISFDQESFKDILDLSKPGEYNVVITAKDMCNNTSTFAFTYKFDDIKPQFSGLAYNKSDNETDWSRSESVTFTVTDSYTNGNGEIINVSDAITEVEYAIVENTDADLTADNIEWKTVVKNNDGLFALEKEDVKDGEYTMYVAVRYVDDCGNEIEPPIQSVNIKKDTVAPEIGDFELSVEKNNVIQNIINSLSHGVYCNESVKIKVYAEDAASGLNKTATLIYNREIAEDDKTIVEGSKTENTYEMALSDDGCYYECELPLTGENYNYIYTDINVVISDNYCISDENGKKSYPNASTKKLGTDNTYVVGLTDENEIIKTQIENSIIQLENIAPVISGPTVNKEVNSLKIDEENIIYNDALVSTIDVSDANSGISQVTVNVKVNGEEEGTDCVFDVYKDTSNSKIDKVSFAYNAKEHTITEIVNGNEVKSIEVTELDILDENKVKLTVNATDNAGNPADEQSYNYTIDNKAPEITSVESNAAEFIRDDVYYKFATDEAHIDKNGAGVVTYSYNDNEEQNITTDENLSIEFSDEGKYVINNIEITDKLGNSRTVNSSDFGVRTDFVIDKTKPTIKEISLKGESETKNYFRAIKLGVFTKDVVKVTVQLDNTTTGGNSKQYTSGLDTALLKLTPVDNQNDYIDFDPTVTENRSKDGKAIDSWTLTYYLPISTIGTLSLEAVDVANNTTGDTAIKNSEDISVKFEDENIENNFFLSENTKPKITITKAPEDIKKATNNDRLVYETVNNSLWFNDDVIIPISIDDPESNPASGLYQVDITVNGEKYLASDDKDVTKAYDYADTNDYLDNKKLSDSFNIDTSKFPIADNGEYKIVVVVTDFAGNVYTDDFSVFKDTETPYVDFEFSGVGNQDSLKNGQVELVELKKSVYGYYFVNDTKVTITATDKNCDKAPVGVKSITYYAVDVNAKGNNGIVISGKDVPVDENNQVSFTIPANFKGQIYAYANDILDNNFSSALVCNEKKLVKNPTGEGSKCVIPDKTIVENAAKHSKETHVSYEVLTKTNTKDASGYNIYNNAVDVKVTITDTYSGIRNGSITVTSDENSTDVNNEYFEIINDGSFKEGKGWTVEKRDGNLVTQISKVIRITRNSNNILVSVSMTDRAGNQTNNVKLRKFSIDTVDPEITVRYSNNSASDGKYFKANRTATITVKERNFDPSLVNAKINGKNVSLKWNGSYSNNSKKEGTTYTATITYGSDGDYKFGISCKDRAGNADNSPRKYSGQTAPTDFVIDKTAPIVTVSNTSTATPQNGNYYSKPVQVTIKVVEHNWDPNKFRITYAENDRNVSKALSWSNSGDNHTATFTCDSSTGLKYTIDYALADKASNNAVFVQSGSRVNDYKPDEFFVDQTIPEISFTGALEGSHNNGTIESGIVLSDTYYDRVEVTLTGKRRGVVLQQTYNETNINITEFVEMSRDNDDYYTVSVVAYDKAGNRNVEPMTRSYSVNRKGSMFVLSADAKKLNGNANSKNIVNSNIVIYEYNVDKTVSEQVELWKNGNVTKLSRGQGYTVSVVENQNGYFCNTYSIAANLFADDAAYRVYITTKDEAGNTSTNTSKNSAALSALDKNNGEAPVLSFIKDTTPPAIDINLDITKMDTYYSIKQNEYIITFTVTDAGSGLNDTSIIVTYSDGDKVTELKPVPVEGQEDTYTITLSGSYDKLNFTVKDNAGNEDNTLEFKRVTVSANPFVRLVANTPLFIGLIVAFVAVAIIIIILIAKRKKDDDEEKNDEIKENKENK